jgi:hypothetical protein
MLKSILFMNSWLSCIVSRVLFCFWGYGEGGDAGSNVSVLFFGVLVFDGLRWRMELVRKWGKGGGCLDLTFLLLLHA